MLLNYQEDKGNALLDLVTRLPMTLERAISMDWWGQKVDSNALRKKRR